MDKDLIILNQKQLEIVNRVKSITITSRKSLEETVFLTRDIKEAKKKVESELKFHTDPLSEQIKNERQKYMPFLDILGKAELELKSKIAVYQSEQEKIRMAEEERLTKLQEKQYAKNIQKAEKKGMEAPPPPPPITIKEEKISGLSMRENWTAEVENVFLIERDFLMPDLDKAKKCAKAGIRKIAGFRIYDKGTVAIGSLAGVSADDDL